MSATRVPAVAPADASTLIKVGYKFARHQFGEVPEPFAVLAQHPKFFMAAARHEQSVQKAMDRPGGMRKEISHLAEFRVATTIGCSWCVDFGQMLTRLDGLDVEKMRRIADFETDSSFNDDERAAIRYADAMTATPTAVTDEQVEDLRIRFGDKAVVELTYIISLENQRARMYSALGITDQGFSTDSCRVPWATEA
ncbi:carboxymuconolactone decarboxylase family protein [Jongsikchunia kroppenstedtii]|uniref:carboxymuconolactone decarboxylase family protein n=1 Tax=Jongsikchunia kroppenstedtii TaxID=1121721 RepID=UPI00037CBB08|nr:carboxymuconolactone decarboxylase family protein [Jongsikchunia kroppenstedtii]